jgi:hypothetical protein
MAYERLVADAEAGSHGLALTNAIGEDGSCVPRIPRLSGLGRRCRCETQTQVSTKAVTRAGYYCSTPTAATLAPWLLRTGSERVTIRLVVAPITRTHPVWRGDR